MNNILYPEKNIQILKKYHTSSKLLIPLIAASYFSNKYNLKNTECFLNLCNTINFSYHSYISVSAIITDYIKPRNISTFLRYSSLFSHKLATFGHIYYCINKNLK